ncbi:hypothetical protein BDV27DRAFT_144949 [Aspergillus caelatus]|uniref:Uncharacterized protein n=1 Tax=Aspergillus caelatus TaxID=61420 RepID=A0A5N7A4L8_9EURO|nr:uncharacterized protein BDV27DRAFT_144949 [Aspergillus caelatus]KAE8364797.1 hypothetical protein BDV27DRAFT_144949 [Aspergillus caelatus]
MTREKSASLNQSTVLVTGDSGGLASQIFQLFSQGGCKHLHSIDLRQPAHRLDGVTYHIGDLTDSNVMRRIFQDVKPNLVIHTASPKFDSPNHIMYRDNLEGTKSLIQVAKESRTQSFVYMSSASVISDAKTDLRSADETYPIILGDRQPEFYLYTKALAGTHIGDNRDLFDFTKSKNVAHGHYLAAEAPVKHQKELPLDSTKVDGEAFFITNDEPRCFWDFTRLVWRYAGDTTRPDQLWVITRPWVLLLAGIFEWVFWALRLGEPPLTRTKVRLSCMTKYFSIAKVKKRLGYKPFVGLEEGLRQAVEDCVLRQKTS